MTIDNITFHLDEAGSEAKAAAHMAAFLDWACRNELLSTKHDRAAIHADPTGYVTERLPVFADSDFTDEGAEFAEEGYSEYLDILNEHAIEAGLSAYEYASSPDGWRRLQEGLDEALAEFRGIEV